MGFRIEEEDAGIVVLELQIAWILQFVEEVEVHHAVILVFFFQDRKVILFVLLHIFSCVCHCFHFITYLYKQFTNSLLIFRLNTLTLQPDKLRFVIVHKTEI